MMSTHRGDSPLIKQSNDAEPTKVITRPGGGLLLCSTPRTIAAVQQVMASAISNPLGLTIEAVYKTIGLIARATPPISIGFVDHRITQAKLNATTAAARKALSRRIKYNPAVELIALAGRPTIA
jgi:hypothetical protein